MLISLFPGILPGLKAAAISDGLQVWYKFDETGGTFAYDSSGNGNNGIIVGGSNASWSTTGRNGSGCISFSGSNTTQAYVSLPANIADTYTTMTAAAWVYCTNSTSDAVSLFTFGPAAASSPSKYIMMLLNGTRFMITTSSNGGEQNITTGTTLTRSVWQHIAVTLNGNTGILYVNGSEVARNTDMTLKPSDLAPMAGGNFIGRSEWTADRYLKGSIDDFRLYNRALSPTEIGSIVTNGLSDSDEVAGVKANLTLGDTSAVTQNITLPEILAPYYDVSIHWFSDNPAVVAADGTVTRPFKGEPTATVNLTATITKNGVNDTKVFAVTVLPIGIAPYSININAAGKGVDISPTLNGIFFEDINYALDGGLYPELIQNRSFEFLRVSSNTVQTADYLFAWKLLQKGGGTGSMTITNTNPLNANNPHYLEVSVTSPGSGVGVYNTGFCTTAGTNPTPGMEIVQNDKYNFSLFIRSKDYSGPLEVALTSADGSVVYATAQLGGISSSWRKLKCVLQPNQSSHTARLQVLVKGTGTVDLDMVSLFPQRTWKNRANGVRYDLGKMLSDMKPKYLRFPGGCVVEGGTVANAYRWKNTVGPLEQRINNWNFWYNSINPDYNQSYGFGYYELFLLAEDIGATALPCVTIGMAMSGANVATGSDLQPYVQDAIDLIDFANSTDMTNQWAKLRSDMGHPAPFNLQFLELGNENSGTNMYTRYTQFANAIRAVHPEIKLICGAGTNNWTDSAYTNCWAWLQTGPKGSNTGGDDADLVDEHYYVANSTFYNNMNWYDNYNRNAQKVFIGEFASNSTANSITDALAEGSYMTHIEENADIVQLASYAPLFGRQSFCQWNPDLIYFNNQMAYGTVDYYVQKLFMRNTGNITLPTEFIKNGNSSYRIQGYFGLGSYNTAVQFKNVVITDNNTGNVVFSDDFSGGSGNWTPVNGTWTASNGVYSQTSSTTINTLAYANTSALSNYTVTFQANKTAGSEGFLLYAGVQDANNYLRWNFGGWTDTKSGFERCVNGSVYQMVPYYDNWKFPSVNTNQWYNLKMVVSGNKVQCYVNGQLAFNIVNRPKNGPVYTIASKDTTTGDIIVKVTNPQATAQTIAVNLNNAAYVNPVGVKTVLKGASSTAANSYTNPANVVPLTTQLTNLGSKNEITFDPYSLTIVRFRTIPGEAPILGSVGIGTSMTTINPGDTVRVDINQSLMSDGSAADLGDAAVTYGTDHPELVSFDSDGKATIASNLDWVTSLKVWVNVLKDGISVQSNQVLLTLEQPPVLASLPNYTIDVGKLLSFTLNGSDPNGDSLIYSAANLPEGASLDPATGKFSWTPSNSQAGTYSVKFTVTGTASDGCQMTDSKSATIVVNYIDQPPVFAVIPHYIVTTEKPLKFSVSVADHDSGDVLTYSVANLPAGASFDPATQTFSWPQPVTGNYTVEFTVSDGQISVTVPTVITVYPNSDRPPVMNAIPSYNVNIGKLVSFTLKASDPDGDVLTYSVANVPDGASFNQATGKFSWMPTVAGTYTVQFTVSDGQLSDSKIATVIVQ